MTIYNIYKYIHHDTHGDKSQRTQHMIHAVWMCLYTKAKFCTARSRVCVRACVRSLNKSKWIAHFCCQYTLAHKYMHTQPHRHIRWKQQNRLKLSFILPRPIFARYYTFTYLFKLGADRWLPNCCTSRVFFHNSNNNNAWRHRTRTRRNELSFDGSNAYTNTHSRTR